MTAVALDEGLLTPDQLHRISQDFAISMHQKSVADANKTKGHLETVRRAFMEREVRPDALNYVMTDVKDFAEQSRHEFLVVQLPVDLLSDSGRRVYRIRSDWPESLQGFGKRADDFHQGHLKPVGYRLRAQTPSYPDRNLGDVGPILCW